MDGLSEAVLTTEEMGTTLELSVETMTEPVPGAPGAPLEARILSELKVELQQPHMKLSITREVEPLMIGSSDANERFLQPGCMKGPNNSILDIQIDCYNGVPGIIGYCNGLKELELAD
ncbi:hypothetical protein T265_09280 [Opisthorchis viverrini]|uniref:Uncharacterized protein n=1 Tax=Opisthorchis viverrini TaxID=6198 RepID=A0A074Z6C9_OPIVI|nr:hypothetical protein T265_09280 [Opisthorchis viverrini]KER22691.1 hypothetical protein T265_09280 [Opisthorchis viverrini]